MRLAAAAVAAAESPQAEHSMPARCLLGMTGGSCWGCVLAGLRTAGRGVQSDEIGEWAGWAVVRVGQVGGPFSSEGWHHLGR